MAGGLDMDLKGWCGWSFEVMYTWIFLCFALIFMESNVFLWIFLNFYAVLNSPCACFCYKGDQIVSVNGHPVMGKSYSQVIELIVAR